MATKPFTGSSRKLNETQTELPRKETETALPQKETESQLPQDRTSEAENSNQTWNIRENVITATESRNVGIFNFNNEYHEGGAVDHHQGMKGQNKTDYNIDCNKIDSKDGEFVGIGKFGNKYYNSRKDEARSSSEEEETSKP
ncbi:hypothetical protein PRUPE_1G184200 [Prunus persica]|uniref:Uncharacterized protein n=1 Tax=Prunus persica TaxID=3760 RepID=A0A251R0E5_PRUPE|nr:hypothetical protein PRUPE_1G184200 [Prunus persica]ONI29161.1 hypothetical protein PRUPE_1G184200 [Prunus persica]